MSDPITWTGWWGDEDEQARADIGGPWVDFTLYAHSDEIGESRYATRRELLEALGGYWYCEVSAARPCKPDDNLGDPEMHFWCHWAVPAGGDDE